MVITLSEDEERMLARHAAAQNLTPEQALRQLISSPPPQRRAWTEQELRQLRDPRNAPRDLAVALGRSVQAVSQRRHQLAYEEDIIELKRTLPGFRYAEKRDAKRRAGLASPPYPLPADPA